MNEKVEIQIGARRLLVEIEGLTPIEINGLAQQVSERLDELHRQNSKIADSSKIALLAALSFAADLDKERSAHDMTRRLLENKAEQLSSALRESLETGAAPPAP
ncbi:MAG: cell division protein ZapA [Elusimicrobia bacterium]|nr:cell division protein ZapA [Elusimicrobiota bacterium]